MPRVTSEDNIAYQFHKIVSSVVNRYGLSSDIDIDADLGIIRHNGNDVYVLPEGRLSQHSYLEIKQVIQSIDNKSESKSSISQHESELTQDESDCNIVILSQDESELTFLTQDESELTFLTQDESELTRYESQSIISNDTSIWCLSDSDNRTSTPILSDESIIVDCANIQYWILLFLLRCTIIFSVV
jgi:hypothetical protein